jgi:hypothetical protein
VTLRRLLLLLFLLAAATRLHAAEASPDWVQSLERITRWFEGNPTNAPTVTARLHVTEAQGFPPGYQGALIDAALQAPQRARFGFGTNRTRIEFGRIDGRLWLWEPGLRRLHVAPLAADRSGIRPVVGLPVSSRVVPHLPSFCLASEPVERLVRGQPCTVTQIQPRPAARDWLGTGDFQVTLWLRRQDGLPEAVRWQEPERKLALTVWPVGLRVERSRPLARWQPPVPAGIVATPLSEAALRQRLPPAVEYLALVTGVLAEAPSR